MRDRTDSVGFNFLVVNMVLVQLREAGRTRTAQAADGVLAFEHTARDHPSQQHYDALLFLIAQGRG